MVTVGMGIGRSLFSMINTTFSNMQGGVRGETVKGNQYQMMWKAFHLGESPTVTNGDSPSLIGRHGTERHGHGHRHGTGESWYGKHDESK